MGGDRRSPPHHRLKGGGGNRTKSGNGGGSAKANSGSSNLKSDFKKEKADFKKPSGNFELKDNSISKGEFSFCRENRNDLECDLEGQNELQTGRDRSEENCDNKCRVEPDIGSSFKENNENGMDKCRMSLNGKMEKPLQSGSFKNGISTLMEPLGLKKNQQGDGAEQDSNMKINVFLDQDCNTSNDNVGLDEGFNSKGKKAMVQQDLTENFQNYAENQDLLDQVFEDSDVSNGERKLSEDDVDMHQTNNSMDLQLHDPFAVKNGNSMENICMDKYRKSSSNFAKQNNGESSQERGQMAFLTRNMVQEQDSAMHVDGSNGDMELLGADQFTGLKFNIHNPVFGIEDNSGQLAMDKIMAQGREADGLKELGVPKYFENHNFTDGVHFFGSMECTDGNRVNACNSSLFNRERNGRGNNNMMEVSSINEARKGLDQGPIQQESVPNAWKKPVHVPVDWQNKGKATDDGKFVKINMDAIGSNQMKLQKALVGKLIGKKLPFNILATEIRKRWEIYGEFKFIMVGEDSFICIFNSCEARDAVLMGGPWLIGGFIVGLDKWSPNFSHESLSGLTSPVWIRLPRLPLLYWDNDNLARIASMVGQPLWIDANTSALARCAYARICVRLDLAQKLLTGVWIPGINGDFFQPVEYEGIHLACFRCGHIGHKSANCDMKKQSNDAERKANTGSGDALHGKSTFGWKSSLEKINSGNMKTIENGCMGKKGLPCSVNLEIGDCSKSKDGGLKVCSENIIARSDNDDADFGPWIFVSRRKNRPGAGRIKAVVQGNKLQEVGTGTSAVGQKNAPAVQEKAFKVAHGKTVKAVQDFTTHKVVLEQPGKVGNRFKADRISVNSLDTAFTDLEQVGAVTSKEELVASKALFNSKGKDVLGKGFNFGNEKDEINKIVVFSASRDENSVFTGDGKATVSRSKDRGSSRVPSSKEISRLGPIATGSRKRRKGNVIDDDCWGFHATCDGAAKESGLLGIVGITDCGGDASPLMS